MNSEESLAKKVNVAAAIDEAKKVNGADAIDEGCFWIYIVTVYGGGGGNCVFVSFLLFCCFLSSLDHSLSLHS